MNLPSLGGLHRSSWSPGFWVARCYTWADADLRNFAASSGTWLEPWAFSSVVLSFPSSGLGAQQVGEVPLSSVSLDCLYLILMVCDLLGCVGGRLSCGLV